LAYLFAVSRGPVTIISTVTALYPILAVLLAYLFLNEPISVKQGLGILLGPVAIVLISG
jgi:transporter family protein